MTRQLFPSPSQGALICAGGSGGGGGSFGGGGGNNEDSKLGLPVVNRKFSVLCEKSSAMLLDAVGSLFNKVPGIGTFISMVIGYAKNAIATSLKALFCSGNFWDSKGPKTMYSKAKNGNELMQTQAFVPAQMNDTTNHLLTLLPKIGKGNYKNTKRPSLTIYTAQAELFYDCNQNWEHEQCDDKPENHFGISNAMMNMRWQTRLVRVRKTRNVQFANTVTEFAQFGSNLGDILSQLGGNIGNIAGSLLGSSGGGQGLFGGFASMFGNNGNGNGNNNGNAGEIGMNVGGMVLDAVFGDNGDFGDIFNQGGFGGNAEGAEPGIYH